MGIFANLIVGVGFYVSDVSDKFLPIDLSRQLNSECAFLIFDNHDIWHLMTALVALCTALFFYHVGERTR